MWLRNGLLLGLLICSTAADVPAQRTSRSYWVYVAAESADLLHRVRFGSGDATVERTTEVGEFFSETEGPHGLRTSPDGRFLYMTTGHGIPDGKFWKIATGPDTVVGTSTFLGRFPATLDLTPDGLYAFVANFNLHGAPEPSTISVVFTPEMVEVAQTTTCTQPHGMRIHPNGLVAYSACVRDDEVVELDTRTFQVSRRFTVVPGQERGVAAATHGSSRRGAAAACGPTWAAPLPSGDRIYVACNKSDEILEVAVDRWTLLRRFPTGRGPYNLAVTPDGNTLIVTLKQGGAVQFFDLASGRSRAVVPSTGTVTHGVVVSPDGRYAFVTVENVGAQPGKVDVVDVGTLTLVASVEVGQQAGGIAFWKTEER